MAEGTLEITISNQRIHGVYASYVTVTGAGGATTISVDKGTLLMLAVVAPANVTDRTVTWSVINGTGTASIIQLYDGTGLLSAITDGTVTVRATANDGSNVYGELVITISNQTAPTLVTTVTVTGAGGATTITTDRGTLQMSAHIDPHDATNQTVVWMIINGTGTGAISTTGLLSAFKNGIITIRAISTDGSGIYGELNITISNQTILTSVPDNFDFSLQDVVDVVQPSSGDALIGCFVDAGATIFDPTHVPGFDSRYEGYHERLTNFRNYPTEVNVNPGDPETLYNWYAVDKHVAGTGNGDIYGALYNWYAATYNTGGASIAPAGWHVPTYTEWLSLRTYLGGYDVAGGKLKETGTTHWNSPNTYADNSSGFTALGGGVRNADGTFSEFKSVCNLHSSTTILESMSLSYDGATFGTTGSDENQGFSIRCLLDGVDPADPGTVTDIDGNVYTTVKIGTQVWMAANLKVTHYNDGTDIPIITNDALWAADTAGTMCYYDNEAPTNIYILPPAGWHVPTKEEFETLSNTLGGWLVAGGHLKQAGYTNWNTPNAGADNSSGFDAIGTGFRDSHLAIPEFTGALEYTFLWNQGNNILTEVFCCYVDRQFSYIYLAVSGENFPFLVHSGMSVRLIKDDSTDNGTMTDIDGNIYPTVKIGTQVWMALNLKVIHYNDGTLIPELSDDNDWINDTDGARCYYV